MLWRLLTLKGLQFCQTEKCKVVKTDEDSEFKFAFTFPWNLRDKASCRLFSTDLYLTRLFSFATTCRYLTDKTSSAQLFKAVTELQKRRDHIFEAFFICKIIFALEYSELVSYADLNNLLEEFFSQNDAVR